MVDSGGTAVDVPYWAVLGGKVEEEALDRTSHSAVRFAVVYGRVAEIVVEREEDNLHVGGRKP